MLEDMARIAPLQPNEAMARSASRRNSTISLDPIFRLLIFVSAFNFRVDRGLGKMAARCHHHQADRTI